MNSDARLSFPDKLPRSPIPTTTGISLELTPRFPVVSLQPVLRRISGSGFALAMVVLIALRLPALGFCLCEHHLVLNSGACCVEAAAVEQSGCEHCVELSQAETAPCRDCVVILSLDPGEFNWSARQFTPAQQDGTPLPIPAGYQDLLLPAPLPGTIAGPLSGSPPPGDSGIYLRTQVLRL